MRIVCPHLLPCLIGCSLCFSNGWPMNSGTFPVSGPHLHTEVLASQRPMLSGQILCGFWDSEIKSSHSDHEGFYSLNLPSPIFFQFPPQTGPCSVAPAGLKLMILRARTTSVSHWTRCNEFWKTSWTIQLLEIVQLFLCGEVFFS